jgi:hypothetical protein
VNGFWSTVDSVQSTVGGCGLGFVSPGILFGGRKIFETFFNDLADIVLDGIDGAVGVYCYPASGVGFG